MTRRVLVLLLAVAACENTTGGSGSATKVAESGTAKGSAGGFSAQMSGELAKAGVGEPTIPPVATPTATPTATPIATPTATPIDNKAPDKAGSASAPDKADATPDKGTPDKGTPDKGTPDKGTPDKGTPDKGTPDKATPSMTATNAVKAPASRQYMKPAGEVASIKFDLEPNWERDMGEAATFSLVVKIPNTDDTRVFSVRYGFEDQNAPIDCDQYKKWLEDRGAMKVTLARQRGAACYIEGTDQGGVIAYRYLLTYGGKRLMCHGSLYKDKESAALGDLRDKVLMQAKKICETLAI